MRSIHRFSRPLAILFLLAFPLLGGCYLLKQGTVLVGYQRQAEDIGRLLADPATSPELRDFLLRVEEIRGYAVDSVGLKRNRNYTRYVQLDRGYLADVVSASARDRFDPHLWRFPFFGSFPYKGFFEPEDALREVEKLRALDLDVLVRPVDAFSTLGFFRDPVYSFMTGYSLYHLASLIIHEQTHATVFFKDQVQFNEELATFVGRQGALDYLRDQRGADSEVYQTALGRLEDEETLFRLFRELHGRLEAVYTGGLEREDTLRRKEEMIEEFLRDLTRSYDQLFLTDAYRRLAERLPINNATILSFSRYTMDLGLFERLHDRLGRDLPATVTFLRSIPRGTRDPKAFIREYLEAGSR